MNFNYNYNQNYIQTQNKQNNALNNQSKRLNLTNNPFGVKLKPHQEALLYKTLNIDQNCSYTNNAFGVLSDKPGSGKTYVVLAMIYFAIKFLNSKGANIIVVPHNIYSQWVSSIDKLLMNKLTYKLLLEYSEINLLYTKPSLIYSYDIILTTSLYYDVFAATLKTLKLNVRRVFFDEADTIKNLLKHQMTCGMTWFISASINRVFDNKNNQAEIGTYKLSLSQLLQNECCCLPEFIDMHIKLKTPLIEDFICKDFYIDNILSKILDKKDMEYINGHDYSKIRILCNGASIKETKDIVEHMYKNSCKILENINTQIKEIEKKLKYLYTIDEKKKYIETKDKLTLDKYFHEKITFNIKSDSIELKLCNKCFKKLNSDENLNITFKKEYYELECGVFICNKCYDDIIQSEKMKNDELEIDKIKIKCNNDLDKCKNGHLISSLKYHVDDIYNNNDESINLNKIIIFEKLLSICNSDNSKILVYSQFRGISNFIKNIVVKYNFEMLELDGGNIKDLDNILDLFKNNIKYKILLIDNTSFGVGLNIEYTTDMIFFNYIENDIKNQLIGRAQRLGRTTRLNIYNLYYKNEI